MGQQVRVALVAVLLLCAPAHAEPPPACTFGPGDLPVKTLPPGTAHGGEIPIANIVVLMQENRSFDHYLGRLRGQKRKNASNPDPTDPGGPPIRAFHETRYCEVADVNHTWNTTHREWNYGAMDGFTTENVHPADPTGRRAMGYYTRRDLPFYYKVYRTFAMGDRYFSSLLSQTTPNRLYLMAGTSFGHIRSDEPPTADDFAQRSVFNLLDEARPPVTWKLYVAARSSVAVKFAYVRNQRAANVAPIAQYFADASAGTLPQVAYVDLTFTDEPNVELDEHAPANVQVGEEFAARVIVALMKGPQWSHAALFLTYDEHGGFYDHVPPPRACEPDGILPILRQRDEPGRFDRYGIRVPAAVVSPFSRRHFVSHTVHDHTSILRFIETRFDLPALTARDANADPMLEFFDFAKARFKKPPRLPRAPIDPVRFAQCASATTSTSTSTTTTTTLPPPAAMLYVDRASSGCSDSGGGAASQPFCTIGAAAARAVAGQTVVVAAGTYTEDVTPANSGTARAPIVFAAAPEARVTVTGGPNAFTLSTKSWITVRGFDVMGTTGDGVSVSNASNITLTANHVSYCGQPVSHRTARGIRLSATTNSLVAGNVVDHNTDFGILLANGTTGVTIVGNEVSHNARVFEHAAAGIRVYGSGANVVDSNVSHDNEDSGIDLAGAANDNLIRNNISYHNGDHGIGLLGSTGVRIIANSVYGNVTAGIDVVGSSGGATLANNISVDNGIQSLLAKGNIRVDSTSTIGTTLDYDLVYLEEGTDLVIWGGSTYSSLAAFVTATGQEIHGTQADPEWASPDAGDLHLRDGSPAIDSADSSASGQGEVDADGNRHVDDPDAPNTGAGPRPYDDRGAYEFQP